MTYTIFRRSLSAVLCNFCVIASGHVENYRELCVIPDYTKPLRKPRFKFTQRTFAGVLSRFDCAPRLLRQTRD